MANDLFLGEAEGHLSGAGTIAIHSQRSPEVTCAGPFTSSAELGGGSGQMRCSNGASGTYHFKRLSLEKGYGTGSYSRRSMSFTYGLTLDESAPYLKLPPGKRLEHNGKTLALYFVGGATRNYQYRQSKDQARLLTMFVVLRAKKRAGEKQPRPR